MLLGAGRARVDSPIDPAVGVILHKKVGDPVEAGEPLCTVLVNDESRLEQALAMIRDAFAIGDAPVGTRLVDRRTVLMPTCQVFSARLAENGPCLRSNSTIAQAKPPWRFSRPWPEPPKLAVVLGSGLGALADQLANRRVIPYAKIPHFPRPTVEGHEGNLVSGSIGGSPALIFQGRFHYYEGYEPR